MFKEFCGIGACSSLIPVGSYSTVGSKAKEEDKAGCELSDLPSKLDLFDLKMLTHVEKTVANMGTQEDSRHDGACVLLFSYCTLMLYPSSSKSLFLIGFLPWALILREDDRSLSMQMCVRMRVQRS